MSCYFDCVHGLLLSKYGPHSLNSNYRVIPILLIISGVFHFTDLVKKAHEFDEKKFLQDSKGAILRPEEIPSVVHAQVALRMVEAAHRIFKEWSYR